MTRTGKQCNEIITSFTSTDTTLGDAKEMLRFVGPKRMLVTIQRAGLGCLDEDSSVSIPAE